MTTPRTHDDGRNERQRQEQEKVERQRQADRDIDDDRKRFEREDDPKERSRLLEEKPFDFIERTKPEDRLDETSRLGQLTRDNVNPNIPSVAPEETGSPVGRVKDPGGIVDPRMLGMESQAGATPAPMQNQPEQWPKKDPETGQAVQQEAPPLPDMTPDQAAARYISPNEPWGSNVGSGEAGGGEPAPGEPLVLTDISPDSVAAGSPEDLVLTVTGSGFTADCVVMVDDEDMTTTLVNSTTLSASVPVAAEPGIVDVEVARGEELSDVLTFEFTAASGTRTNKGPERKAKKAEPRGKRTKKDKGKGRK